MSGDKAKSDFPSTSERAQFAMDSFDLREDGWQSKWSLAIGAIAVNSIHRTPHGANDSDKQTIKEFLKRTAEMISDEGSRNRVFFEGGKKPEKTHAKQRMQRSISIIYSVCSEKAKRSGAENQKETALTHAAMALKFKFTKDKIGSIIANNPRPKIPENAGLGVKPSDKELDEIVKRHADFVIFSME